jgi:hypothetical protein
MGFFAKKKLPKQELKKEALAPEQEAVPFAEDEPAAGDEPAVLSFVAIRFQHGGESEYDGGEGQAFVLEVSAAEEEQQETSEQTTTTKEGNAHMRFLLNKIQKAIDEEEYAQGELQEASSISASSDATFDD